MGAERLGPPRSDRPRVRAGRSHSRPTSPPTTSLSVVERHAGPVDRHTAPRARLAAVELELVSSRPLTGTEALPIAARPKFARRHRRFLRVAPGAAVPTRRLRASRAGGASTSCPSKRPVAAESPTRCPSATRSGCRPGRCGHGTTGSQPESASEVTRTSARWRPLNVGTWRDMNLSEADGRAEPPGSLFPIPVLSPGPATTLGETPVFLWKPPAAWVRGRPSELLFGRLAPRPS